MDADLHRHTHQPVEPHSDSQTQARPPTRPATAAARQKPGGDIESSLALPAGSRRVHGVGASTNVRWAAPTRQDLWVRAMRAAPTANLMLKGHTVAVDRAAVSSPGAIAGFRRGRGRWWLAGLLAALATGGCSQGISWRGYAFAPVFNESRRDGKLTFVYFRNWAVVECTNFEEQVLKDPAVRQALRSGGPFYAVVLDYFWDRELARKWQLDQPPAVVILDPQGRVLGRATGKIGVQQLLTLLRQAQATQQARSRSAPTRQPGR